MLSLRGNLHAHVSKMMTVAPRLMRRLLLALALLHVADALFFFVTEETHRCFLADVPAQTTFHAEYESPDTSDTLRTVVAVYAPSGDPAKPNKLMKKEVTTSKGAVPYTSTQNGEHWVCVSLDSAEYAMPQGTKMRFVLRIAMGPSKKEYQDLARKGHMDDLQLEVLKLRDRVSAIQRNQDYIKTKRQLLQTRIESNNSKAMWVSIVQIGMLLITAFFQVQHLRQFFHKKKLV
ncbi:hypothetical protein PINS_up001141 [Pythium insidiosum]|nr:hypothetical protein PINS_up001141 [Pythium insidiosum]